MFNLSHEQFRQAAVLLIALILSIAVHEYGHALIADKLGDRTPRSQGRVTLNPFAHVDLIGTIIFPLVAIFSFGGVLFGWGKPVMVSPAAFTRKLRMKIAHLLVAAAGPAMNVLLAVLVTVLYAILVGTGVLSLASEITKGIILVIQLNWILFFFNLIPCPPLDGGTVLAGLLPDRHHNVIEFLNQWGFVILIGLLVTGAVRIFVMPAIWLTTLSLRLVHGF